MGLNGHFVIGLTGSIGAGKSLVRKMLMHKGALGLDADMLAHDSYARGAPAYDALVNHFGKGILDAEDRISRPELGKRVFGNPDALKKLEEFVHPLVFQAAQNLVNHSALPIIVIEAIKLLESDLVDLCDSIWVVNTSQQRILARLKATRGIAQDQIEERLAQQSSPEEKIRRADVVINNSSSISSTWDELNAHWEGLIKSDIKFQLLEGETQSMLAPFNDILIPPSQDQAKKMAGWLIQEPSTLASLVFNSMAAKIGGGVADQIGKVQSAFQLLCELFFAQYLEKGGLEALACWEMRHLALHVTWLPVFGNTTDKILEGFLEKIEAFSRLNLCRKVTLPVPSSAVYEVERMGYQIRTDGLCGEIDFSVSGYNHYQKVLDPVVDLFKINNE